MNEALKRELLGNIVKVDSPLGPPCWIWTGGLTSDGYGQWQLDGHPRRVHRLSYEIFVRSIPAGMHCLHHCDNRACINPTHLYLGTNQDNVDDAIRRNRRRQGPPMRGELHGCSTITDLRASEIKFLALEGHLYLHEIANHYGVSDTVVDNIKAGRTHAHVEPRELSAPPPPRQKILRRM
jgi:HNH endonuclease